MHQQACRAFRAARQRYSSPQAMALLLSRFLGKSPDHRDTGSSVSSSKISITTTNLSPQPSRSSSTGLSDHHTSYQRRKYRPQPNRIVSIVAIRITIVTIECTRVGVVVVEVDRRYAPPHKAHSTAHFNEDPF